MSRVSRARRIATAAIYGGGGLGAAGAMLTGLLYGQVHAARRAIKPPGGPPPRGDGDYGPPWEDGHVRLAVLGDSSAAGLGVELPSQTLGAVIAAELADLLDRPVRLRCFAVVGARSADLDIQINAALPHRPDVVVIFVGANDVTHRVRPAVAVHHLAQAVHRLREAGCEVVVGTCPDLGTIRPIRPPLRWLARRWSRELAAAQTIAVVEAGGRTVSLGDVLGPEFAAAPYELFSEDLFHPSAAGYAAAAAAVLPTVAAALQPATDEVGDLRSLPRAAVEAADRAGTEVSATEVAGRERGPRGRWALLRRGGSRTTMGEVSAAVAEEGV